jgi:diketogulonate reductase-like aldo/keto reductase
VHPLYQEHDTIELCRQNDILVEAYSPLAQFNKKLVENETIARISQKNGLDIPRTILTYLLAKGFVVLPRSSKEDHIANNILLEGLELSETDIEELDNLSKN